MPAMTVCVCRLVSRGGEENERSAFADCCGCSGRCGIACAGEVG